MVHISQDVSLQFGPHLVPHYTHNTITKLDSRPDSGSNCFFFNVNPDQDLQNFKGGAVV